MNRFAIQELAAGVMFFVACGWLVIDAVRSYPDAVPTLWPLIPMFTAVVWYGASINDLSITFGQLIKLFLLLIFTLDVL